MLHPFGNMRNGCLRRRSNSHGLIIQDTQSSALMD
jgi:hypothetical protein